MKKIIPVLIFIFLPACFYFHTEVEELPVKDLMKSESYNIESKTKVHLENGGLIVYPDGFVMQQDTLFGNGLLYNVLRDSSIEINTYPFDSTAFYEYYSNMYEPETTILTAPVAFMGTGLLMVAIFGSCPTIYSTEDTVSALEAELFSYSVAEMFEQSDLDKLNYLTVKNNKTKLLLTNEALETHYIDKLALGIVEHNKNYQAFPTDEEEVLLVGEYANPIHVENRKHESIEKLVTNKDSLFYETDSLLLKELTNRITSDWIDLEYDIPPGKEEAVVVVNYKNTLLNTILLYDVMLGSQGAEAVDWIGDKTDNLWYAYNFDKWYRSHFGIHVKVFDGDEYTEVYRLSDTGPITWHESAFEIEIPEVNKLKLRLEFLPDNFKIDQVNVSFDLSEDYEYKEINVSEMTNNHNSQKVASLLLNDDDEEYFITHPGDSYNLIFDTPPCPGNKVQSYFVSSNGYYVEWIRKDWIKNGLQLNKGIVFDYNDDAIKRTAEIWLSKRATFEKLFLEKKVK